MDETNKQLLDEVRAPLPMQPGEVRKGDFQYERLGVENVFVFTAPAIGWRRMRADWA
jgi:hypothetical protein